MDFARRTLSSVLIVVAVFCTGAAAYNYSRSGEDWDAPCLTGMAQSPINIVTKATVLLPFQLFMLDYYKYSSFSVVNTGHAVEVIPTGGLSSNLTLNFGGVYTLTQFHFHSVSEHAIDGDFGALECHLVHTSSNFDFQIPYVVVAVIFRIHPHNKNNEFIDSFLKYVPMDASSVNVSASLELKSLFFAGGPGEPVKYWSYLGSLTTPLCLEGVAWIVLSENQYISISQMARFLDLVSDVSNGERTNNRLPQPLNARPVYRFESTI